MKHNKQNIILSLVAMISFGAFAQKDSTAVETKPPRMTDMVSLGFGLGMDHGGYGANLLVYPQKNIGIFAGLGYNMDGAGYNVGAKLRLISDKKFHKASPYLLGMYGYNAVIVVQNASQYDKTFYGSTFGLGLDYKFRQASKGYWNVALLLPIRSSEVESYIDDLRDNHGVEMKSGLSAVAFSLGYRVILD